jgi:hypothetical protein
MRMGPADEGKTSTVRLFKNSGEPSQCDFLLAEFAVPEGECPRGKTRHWALWDVGGLRRPKIGFEVETIGLRPLSRS